MRLHLSHRWIEYLCQLPETGMGYQRVDIRLKNGDKLNNVVVFNSEELEYQFRGVSFRSEDIAEIQLHHEPVS